MQIPTSWELFQNILIGTVAGVMASAVGDRGPAYVFVLATMLWILVVVTLYLAKVSFEWIGSGENDDNEIENRPYKDVNHAS